MNDIEDYDSLPEWDYFLINDGYTGPYWSDYKFQQSVADGRHVPTSKLEALSKRHDADYRNNGSGGQLDADIAYFEATRGMGFVPEAVGGIPIVYNQVAPFLALDPWGFIEFLERGENNNMQAIGKPKAKVSTSTLNAYSKKEAPGTAVKPPTDVYLYGGNGRPATTKPPNEQTQKPTTVYDPKLKPTSQPGDEYTNTSPNGSSSYYGTLQSFFTRGERRRRNKGWLPKSLSYARRSKVYIS